MNEIMGNLRQEDNQQQKKDNKKTSLISILTREIIAIICWIYVITKLFIFDIDIYIIERYFSDYAWVINYKFFILIGTLAIIWLLTKNRQLIIWSLFIFFYPVVLLFWRIPYFRS